MVFLLVEFYSGSGVNGNTFFPQVSGAGDHDLTYVLTVGTCVDSQTVTIHVDSIVPAVLNSIGPFCEEDAQLTLTQGNPVGGIYKVNGGVNTTFSPIALGAGQQNVEYIYTNGACADTTDITVSIDSMPNLSFSSIQDVCESIVSLPLNQGSPNGGVYANQYVSNGNFLASSAGAGNHTITYSMSNGACLAIDSQIVNVIPVPNAQFSLPSEICLNQGITNLNSATPTGGIYSGAGIAGNVINLTNLQAGVETYSYIVSQGGCSDTAYASTLLMEEALGQVIAGGDTEICEGDYITLNGIGGEQYVWNTGDSSQFIVTDSSGWYVCNITNQCGGGKDSVYVDVLLIPSVDILTDTTVICDGTSVQILGKSNVGFEWSTGSTDSIIEVKNEGVYKLEYQNKCGNSHDSISIDVASVSAFFEYTYDQFNNPYEVVFENYSEGATEYVWNFGDADTASIVNPSHTYLDFDSYIISLEAINDIGCTDVYTVDIDVTIPAHVFIPTAFTPNGDGLNDSYAISSSYHSTFFGALFDRWGNQVFEFSDSEDYWDGTVDQKLAPAGIYVYRFDIDGKIYSGKLTLIR